MANEKKGIIKKFVEEFKAFALKGNVMDMAVGVIIGAAFGNIVTSLTDNFINPLIACITGGAKKDENGVMQLVGGSFKINGVSFNYGAFLSAVINFLIIALILFCLLKAVNKAMTLGKKEEAPAAPTTKVCPHCKSEVHIEATRCPHCTSELIE
ncbi:MAG: large conductance mechanosensitive channel protein MscL [Oscillospiraceae bacterium]